MPNVGEDIGFLKAEIIGIKEDIKEVKDVVKPIPSKVLRLELIVGLATALAGFIASQVIGLWPDIIGRLTGHIQ